jgi:hypothetical protein
VARPQARNAACSKDNQTLNFPVILHTEKISVILLTHIRRPAIVSNHIVPHVLHVQWLLQSMSLISSSSLILTLEEYLTIHFHVFFHFQWLLQSMLLLSSLLILEYHCSILCKLLHVYRSICMKRQRAPLLPTRSLKCLSNAGRSAWSHETPMLHTALKISQAGMAPNRATSLSSFLQECKAAVQSRVQWI